MKGDKMGKQKTDEEFKKEFYDKFPNSSVNIIGNYINARTKIEILDYLSTRHDNNPALFVQRKYPYERFQRGGIRHMLNDIENRTGIVNIHPHRFRRTLATSLLEKGMSLEQVKVILGHKRIETTLVYAGINQTDTKLNHQRYT